MAHEVLSFVSGKRYVCCHCNRAALKPKVSIRSERLCSQCGHALVADRSVALAFAVGALWSGAVMLTTAAAAYLLPDSQTTSTAVGSAICAGLACKKLFEGSGHSEVAEPAASIHRQTMAEGAGAFAVVLVGSLLLFR